MKSKLAIACIVLGSLAAPIYSYASEDADMDRDQPAAFVKDSTITTKVKAKLAAQHLTSLAHIQVDTDANGVVWLSGDAKTQAEIDQAVAIAKSTEGVVTVKNNLKIQKDA
jgi:hyperosmotically inducible periplasmic protein